MKQLDKRNQNLPIGWIYAEYSELSPKITDGTHFTPKYTEKGIPFISVKDIYDGKVHFEKCRYVSKETHEKLIQRCNPEKGDILITKSGTIGRIAVITTEKDFSLFVSVALIKIFSKFLSSKMLSFSLENYINSIDIAQDVKGGVVKNLHLEDIREIGLALPPFPEQHRIVDKLEELFSELDNGVENLKKAQIQLKTYRQAVLKYAFKGKLTEEWRKKNNPEPAEKLLEQIKSEREKHYQQQLKDWERACKQAKTDGTKKPSKPQKPKDLSLLTDAGLKDLPELPEGWCWCNLSDLSYLITKGASPTWQGFNYVDDPAQVLFITSENVRDNFINIDKPKFLENAFNLKQKNSILKKGDVLLNIVGASIGRASTYELDFDANINQAVSLIRLIDQGLKDFIALFLNSSFANKFYTSKKVDVARANLSLADVASIPIPISSMVEIFYIVSEIESRLSVCDKIEQTIEESLKQAEALRQSILKKAFEGKLVPQDPNDEPAEKLLERIRAEKEKLEALIKSKKNSVKKREKATA